MTKRAATEERHADIVRRFREAVEDGAATHHAAITKVVEDLAPHAGRNTVLAATKDYRDRNPMAKPVPEASTIQAAIMVDLAARRVLLQICRDLGVAETMAVMVALGENTRP